MHLGRFFLMAVLILEGFLSARVSVVDAKETFTDEAGRMIYTIDDDGTVSMFENSPTDLTLSVTRGTREQMRPQITGLTPESVSAGAFANLKLRGKNLVGAKVKLSVPAIEMGPYAGKPESLDISLRVPPTIPPGEVILEVTTPVGTTKATLKITDLQFGGGQSARRDARGHQTITTSAPSSCPDGMVGVAAESGGFCIEIDRSLSGDIRKAEKACAMAGKRLCQANEWQHACEQSKANGLDLKNIIGEWEWTGSYAKYDVQVQTGDLDLSDELKSVLLGKADCVTQKLYPSWRPGPFPGRCCK